MTDNLGIDLTVVLADIVPLYFAEAETNVYPFCVYRRVIREVRDKDGVCAIRSELTLEVVSDDYEEAKAKAAAVRGAVEVLGDDYRVAFQSCEPSCVEGVWDFIIDYNINQIN